METQVNTQSDTAVNLLVHGECLIGKVKKPFIKDNALQGAVLAFDGKSETALLHLRQMSGEANERLSELGIEDSLMVRIIVVGEGSERKVWATEKGVEHQHLIDLFSEDPEQFKNIEGRVHGLTEFGVFVQLIDGPVQGHTGLLRTSNPQSGRVKLGSFLPFKVGDGLMVDVAELRIDDSNRDTKLLVRLENVRLNRKAA